MVAAPDKGATNDELSNGSTRQDIEVLINDIRRNIGEGLSNIAFGCVAIHKTSTTSYGHLTGPGDVVRKR
jgi:hypothetical protein